MLFAPTTAGLSNNEPTKEELAIHADESEWLVTMPAGVRKVFDFWKEHLRDGGFKYGSRIIGFPHGGRPIHLMAERQLGRLVRHISNAGAGECDEYVKLPERQKQAATRKRTQDMTCAKAIWPSAGGFKRIDGRTVQAIPVAAIELV